jgi:shikimate 5-dehydrogenase
MEAYYQQVSVSELESVYHYSTITKSTPLVAVTGFGEVQYVTVALLNASFAHLGEPLRCLPMEIGSNPLFRKVLEVVKVKCAVIDGLHQGDVRELAEALKPSANLAEAVDFLTQEDGKWQGHHIFYRAVLAEVADTLRANRPAESGHPTEGALKGKVILFVGANGLCRVLATGAHQAGAVPIIAGGNQYAVQTLAKSLGCRFIDEEEPLDKVSHDILIRCDDNDLDPSILKAGTTVVDTTALPRPSYLLDQARQLGCHVVSPERLLVGLVNRYLRAIAGQTVPNEFLLEKLHPMLEH